MRLKHIVVALFLSVLTACNWVDVSSEGQAVRLVEEDAVNNCERVGRTRSQTTDRVLFVDRNRDKLREELVSLARNEAAQLGGNRIVAESEVVDGRQSFGVYRCP